VLTTAGAQRLGITPAQVRTELRRERWRRLGSGVLLTRPDEPTREDWAHAGLALAGRGAAVSGWDAIRVHDLGPRTPPVSHVLVVTPRGRNRRVGGLRIRPSKRPVDIHTVPAYAECLQGARVVSAARALADTALDLDQLASVRAMVTSAIQRRLCVVDELRAELEASPQNGSAHLRTSLEDVLAGAQSVAEAEAIRFLTNAQLPAFEVNAAVHDPADKFVAVVDVLWRQLRFALEVDSREFHFSEVDWRHTMHRHNRLSRLGYAVAHYAPSDVRRRKADWAREVGQALRARANELGLPWPPPPPSPP
jgi:hypothetical protein